MEEVRGARGCDGECTPGQRACECTPALHRRTTVCANAPRPPPILRRAYILPCTPSSRRRTAQLPPPFSLRAFSRGLRAASAWACTNHIWVRIAQSGSC
ncbi:hypothetical protein EON67_02735 [archaeon]|nr:MAG: hypothetical protein EON67_02735 [archaeon]